MNYNYKIKEEKFKNETDENKKRNTTWELTKTDK